MNNIISLADTQWILKVLCSHNLVLIRNPHTRERLYLPLMDDALSRYSVFYLCTQILMTPLHPHLIFWVGAVVPAQNVL